MSNPDKIEEVLTLWRKLYSLEDGLGGGPAHVVTDDGNLNNASIDFCIDWCDESVLRGRSTKEVSDIARELLLKIRELTNKERNRAYRTFWGY